MTTSCGPPPKRAKAGSKKAGGRVRREEIEVRLLDTTRCAVSHSPSGAELVTEVAPEYGGTGTSFSSTDLVAAALGSCIASSLAPVLRRDGVPAEALRIGVHKKLRGAPKGIERLNVVIHLSASLPRGQLAKLCNIARTCPVGRSLAPELLVAIEIRHTANDNA